MTRILTYASLAASVLGALGAAGQQPTFRGVSDAVRVFVTVTDRDGRLVTTLSRDDFELRTSLATLRPNATGRCTRSTCAFLNMG